MGQLRQVRLEVEAMTDARDDELENTSLLKGAFFRKGGTFEPTKVRVIGASTGVTRHTAEAAADAKTEAKDEAIRTDVDTTTETDTDAENQQPGDV